MENEPLEVFEIERWELHVGTIHVEARSAAHALARMLMGDGDQVGGSVFHGHCEQRGLPVDEDLRQQLLEHGVDIRKLIESVRSVRATGEIIED